MSKRIFRQFVVISSEHVSLNAGHYDLHAAAALLQKLLPAGLDYIPLGVPCAGWEIYIGDDEKGQPVQNDDLTVSLGFPCETAVADFYNAVEDANAGARSVNKAPPFVEYGADISGGETGYFCPAGLDQLLFGDRAAADRLTRACDLPGWLRGDGVNVVVLDHGFDRHRVRNFGGGWSRRGGPRPGRTHRGHGLMIVRNILETVPNATFWDIPLIPLAIDNINGFLATARCAVRGVLRYVKGLGDHRPWVMVNAWAIYDRSSEYPPGDYTENTRPGGHPFNRLITKVVDAGIDVVFAAGNCGQFCPDRRCARIDCGPGRSIWGANSHPRVISTGAVRTDARWLGNASQGPGQAGLASTPEEGPLAIGKPDLCAPSNFRDKHDAFVGNTDMPWIGDSGSPYIANTGTSAACALTAGIVAALRSDPRWPPARVPPEVLKNRLTATARKIEGPLWNGHLGHGIINAKDAFDDLEILFA
jgi:hypothetical protein